MADNLLIVGFCVAAVLAIGYILRAGGPRLRLEKRPLMSAIERQTLGFLEAAVPHCRVYPQVSMGALLKPVRGLSRKEHMSARGRFSQKIVDYVLEDRRTGEVIALVELDDRSHNHDRDRQRDELTASAGYTTIRLPAKERPTLAGVQQRVIQALAPSVEAGPGKAAGQPGAGTPVRPARL